jgi:penicillin G amidase
MKEMQAFDGFFDVYGAKTPADMAKLVRNIPLTFNFFYATKNGDVGYHYCGFVPVRASGLDPRFPTPATPENEWKGMIPPEKMPRLLNPKKGLIANWNNKSVSWWPNFDTPVWGRIFRNSALLSNLQKPLLSPQDLEMAAWNIARMDENAPFFMPHLSRLSTAGFTPLEKDAFSYLKEFNGWTVEGSVSASVWRATFDALREEIFMKHTGGFLSPDLFALAAQPTTMLKALEGKTNYNYLAGRIASEVLTAAFKKGVQRLQTQRGPDPSQWGAASSGIQVPGQPPIPYIKRGTYIQIVEIRDQPRGRNVMPPGVAEAGPHALDQVPLARAWTYKPMRWWKD